MTSFHLVATSASLRFDILQILLDEYPLKVLAQKDKRDKTVMDYLLLNQSPKAVPLIKMILEKTLMNVSPQWRFRKWKLNLIEQIDQASWEAGSLTRRNLLNDVLEALASYTKVESTSILEEALWKRTIIQCSASVYSDNDDIHGSTTTKKRNIERHQCRVVCTANVVLPNVLAYLWSSGGSSSDDELDSSGTRFATDVLPPEVSWLQGEIDSDDDWDTW